MTEYGYQVEVPEGYDEAVVRTRLATRGEGFSVITEMHVGEALGPALATHAMFPSGTNVEFAHVEAPDRVRILIWERGVGPTTSSGTGASASAVAAAAHGGAGAR